MGTLQVRSIIDLGQGSYVITLPKPWLRFHNLKPGDKVEVITNRKLVVSPCKRPGGGLARDARERRRPATRGHSHRRGSAR